MFPECIPQASRFVGTEPPWQVSGWHPRNIDVTIPEGLSDFSPKMAERRAPILYSFATTSSLWLGARCGVCPYSMGSFESFHLPHNSFWASTSSTQIRHQLHIQGRAVSFEGDRTAHRRRQTSYVAGQSSVSILPEKQGPPMLAEMETIAESWDIQPHAVSSSDPDRGVVPTLISAEFERLTTSSLRASTAMSRYSIGEQSNHTYKGHAFRVTAISRLRLITHS